MAGLGRLRELGSPCRLGPRECGARRLDGGRGFCGAGPVPIVASAGAHRGEEECLTGGFGGGGSGTIFLGGCNLLCLFCQNADLSHGRAGREMPPPGVAALMLELERSGCHNVNLVTPTHFAPALAEAVGLARAAGLAAPVVWNCGGYESVAALRALEGAVEIYMPDAKTLDPGFAASALQARDYPERMREAITEMQRQVGDMVIEGGLAVRGLLVRHLVMPGMVADSIRVLDFLAREVSPSAFVNVMGQYRPCHRAREVEGLSRRPTPEEIEAVRAHARELGLRLARD